MEIWLSQLLCKYLALKVLGPLLYSFYGEWSMFCKLLLVCLWWTWISQQMQYFSIVSLKIYPLSIFYPRMKSSQWSLISQIQMRVMSHQFLSKVLISFNHSTFLTPHLFLNSFLRYQSKNIIKNMGSMFYYIVGVILAIAFTFLLWFLAKRY